MTAKTQLYVLKYVCERLCYSEVHSEDQNFYKMKN